MAACNSNRLQYTLFGPTRMPKKLRRDVGDYDLAVEIHSKPSGCLVDPLARKIVRVTVTEADVAAGRLVIPEVKTPVVPVPAVRDTPKLTFRRADGTEGTLAGNRGRWTVVLCDEAKLTPQGAAGVVRDS